MVVVEDPSQTRTTPAMPSSPTRPVRTQPTRPSGGPGLLELLEHLPDPRRRRGIRHRLPVLVALGLVAVLAGARSFAAIGEWVADQDEASLASLGLLAAAGATRPSESAIRRAFARLDAQVLDQVLGAWMWTRTHVVDQRRVIAIDGKTIRGARTAHRVAPHLVAAHDHATGAVLGQLAVETKSNEIPAVRDLLTCMNIEGAVITVDAMHTQGETASLVLAAGGDYVFTVKNNQPTLYAACKKLPWSKVPSRRGIGHRSTSTGHGRRATRSIKVVEAPAWIEFTGATQVAQIRRTVTRQGKKSVEVVYVITSADHHAAPPARLAAWVQGHWTIENQLHWVRDVTFDEDRSQVRTGSAPGPRPR